MESVRIVPHYFNQWNLLRILDYYYYGSTSSSGVLGHRCRFSNGPVLQMALILRSILARLLRSDHRVFARWKQSTTPKTRQGGAPFLQQPPLALSLDHLQDPYKCTTHSL